MTHDNYERRRQRVERSISIAHFDGEPVTMLDTLASKARTALDDPGAIDLRFEALPALRESYAIERLDEIIGLLNPAYETRETFADTLTILGRHLAERADVMESVDADGPSGDRAAYVNAAALVHRALDVLDEAIAELRPDDPEPVATGDPHERLEYLRTELRAERISWGELAELQSLAAFIPEGDVELLEAAGVPEHPEEDEQGKAELRPDDPDGATCDAWMSGEVSEGIEGAEGFCPLPFGHSGPHVPPRAEQ